MAIASIISHTHDDFVKEEKQNEIKELWECA